MGFVKTVFKVATTIFMIGVATGCLIGYQVWGVAA